MEILTAIGMASDLPRTLQCAGLAGCRSITMATTGGALAQMMAADCSSTIGTSSTMMGFMAIAGETQTIGLEGDL
jgi:hypothetical protein